MEAPTGERNLRVTFHATLITTLDVVQEPIPAGAYTLIYDVDDVVNQVKV
jgi:hypothetical protein